MLRNNRTFVFRDVACSVLLGARSRKMDAFANLARELALAEFSLADQYALLWATLLARRWPNLDEDQRKHVVSLWHLAQVVAAERVFYPRQRIDMAALPEYRFRAYFRFQADHIDRLIIALRLPAVLVTADGHRSGARDGMLLLLRRLASRQNLVEMEDQFGHSSAAISAITWELMRLLFMSFSRKIFGENLCWEADRLTLYALAIKQLLEILCGEQWPARHFPICGFIDGSFFETCRPRDDQPGEDLQRSLYSGFYRAHGYRVHTIIFADGMIGHTTRRLIAGRQNDNVMFDRSGCA